MVGDGDCVVGDSVVGDSVVGDSVVGDSVVGVAVVSAAVINVPLQEPGARNVKIAFNFSTQAVVKMSASLQYHCAFSLQSSRRVCNMEANDIDKCKIGKVID